MALADIAHLFPGGPKIKVSPRTHTKRTSGGGEGMNNESSGMAEGQAVIIVEIIIAPIEKCIRPRPETAPELINP